MLSRATFANARTSARPAVTGSPHAPAVSTTKRAYPVGVHAAKEAGCRVLHVENVRDVNLENVEARLDTGAEAER